MEAHVTSEELAQLRSGKLPPEEALRVLRHRAVCAECRGGQTSAADLKVLRGLLEFDACPAQTPDGEQLLVQFALGQLAPEKSESLAAHAAGCVRCQDILNELREDRAELTHSGKNVIVMKPRRQPAIWLIATAAAIIAAVGGAVWFGLHSRSTLEANVDRIRDGGSVLERKAGGEWTGVTYRDPSDRELVASVLHSGRLPAPLAPIQAPQPTVLRGASGSAPFTLISPAYVRVESDQPEFSWTAWNEATSYQVAVFTMDNRILDISPALPRSASSWTSAKPLPRGIRLAWQVTATRRRGDPVLVPAPPAPPVFFEVIGSEAAQRIAQAKAANPPSRLLLAALYAGQGLAQQAQAEIDALARENPQSQLLQRIVQAR